jgi:hypothetical protein
MKKFILVLVAGGSLYAMDSNQRNSEGDKGQNFIVDKLVAKQLETAKTLAPLAKSQPDLAQVLAERAAREDIEFGLMLAKAFIKAEDALKEMREKKQNKNT